MLDILKSVGKNTPHEYARDLVIAPMPRKRGDNRPVTSGIKIDRTIWYDKMGICYKLINDTLCITTNGLFPESIVDYINSIPNNMNIKIVMRLFIGSNEVAGFNMLCDMLARIPTNKLITLDISDFKIGVGCDLAFERLPSNVKISNCIDSSLGEEQNPFYGNNSFDWWTLHCDDASYNVLLTKLAPVARKRAMDLRNIAFNFYRYTPESIKNASIKEKCDFVYGWCCEHIQYDFGGTMTDGSFNYDRRDTQDPIATYQRRKGVCVGRATLLKLLLNNYYMKTPIFLVDGTTGRLQHTWNELILEDGSSIIYDISHQSNLIGRVHDDYELSKYYVDKIIGKGSRN